MSRRELPDPRGIDQILAALSYLTERTERRPEFTELGRELAHEAPSRARAIERFVDELHRRFVYAPDPVKVEYVGPVPWTPGESIDVDDAYLFVGALAMSAGIPARPVAARFDRVWTLFLEYQDETGTWHRINPLRQDWRREPDELRRVSAPIGSPAETPETRGS